MKDVCTLAEMQQMEVVNIRDGKRLGSVCDVEIDWKCGQVEAIIVPGHNRFFGFWGREADYVIAWHEIQKIGKDIILVSFDPAQEEKPPKDKKKQKFL